MGVQDESIPCPPRALELQQSREGAKPRKNKATKAQSREGAKPRKAAKEQSHQGTKPPRRKTAQSHKGNKIASRRREESRATKPHKPRYRTIKPRNAAQAKRTAQKRRVMRNHTTKPQKITQTTERKAEQEPERPSLRYRLEGENKLRRATHNKAAKSRTQRSREEEPRNEAAKSRTPMPTKPKEAKPDVGRLTLELEGAC